MIKFSMKTGIVILIIAMAPGTLLYLYSSTLFREGFVAVNFWWGGNEPLEETELAVNESCPIASKVINAERLVIGPFNTSGSTVSILVTCERDGIILNQSLVSGEVEGVMFPEQEPTGWVQSQDFVVSVLWEGYNTTVYFTYLTQSVSHSDGFVQYTLPGAYESRNLSIVLLGVGVIVVIVYVIIARPTVIH
jgi:hypothetical protein